MTLSFVDKLYNQQGKCYFYRFTAQDVSGRNAWYIVQILPEQHQPFEDALKHSSTLKLTDYGTIVRSGFGDTIPENPK